MNSTTGESGRRIQVVYEDNEGKANKAVDAFRKLVNQDNASVVFSCFTPIGSALRDLAATSQVPLLATVTSAHNFAATSEWVFRDFPTQGQQATALAKYVYNEMDLRMGTSLVVNDDYGLDGARIFSSVFTQHGGEFTEGDVFLQSDMEMRNQINKLLSTNPEFILVIGRDQSLANVCIQIREITDNVRIVGVNAFDASIVWEMAGEAGDGIVFTSAYLDYAANQQASAFKQKYVKTYSEEPNYVSVYGYSIGKYVGSLLLEIGPDRHRIKERLTELRTESIRGFLSMSADRDVISPIGIYARDGGVTRLIARSE